jgi:hypothetical protein
LIIFEKSIHPIDIESGFFKGNQTATLEKTLKFRKVFFDGYPIGAPRLDITAAEYAACNLIGIILRLCYNFAGIFDGIT